MKTNTELKERILEISKKRSSTHISSCLTALPIIREIYERKKSDDVFVLSNGHAFLAWAVIKEAYEGMNAEDLVERHGTHPNRSEKDRIAVSTGSLGHGLGASLGMALANRDGDYYCLISDGECAEGSIFEALRLKTELQVKNLHVYANLNGYSALGKIDRQYLTVRLGVTCPDIEIRITENDPGFEGVAGHYKKV